MRKKDRRSSRKSSKSSSKSSPNYSNEFIINEIKKIKVTKPESTGMIVNNPTDLPILNQGEKRVVIGIDQTRCAVFFEDEDKAEKEFQSLRMGEKSGITPKAFGRRGTYVVMEQLKASTLADYLMHNSITKEITKKLLGLLKEFQAVGYTRLDSDPSYIYLMPDTTLKVVNLYRHTKIPARVFPQRMIKGMGKQVDLFLKYVRELEPKTYDTWAKHPKFTITVEKAKL